MKLENNKATHLENSALRRERHQQLPSISNVQTKIANFSRYHSLAIPKGDLSTKKTKRNIEMQPESLEFMLELFFIESGLLRTITNKIKNKIQTNQLISDLLQSYLFFSYFFQLNLACFSFKGRNKKKSLIAG